MLGTCFVCLYVVPEQRNVRIPETSARQPMNLHSTPARQPLLAGKLATLTRGTAASRPLPALGGSPSGPSSPFSSWGPSQLFSSALLLLTGGALALWLRPAPPAQWAAAAASGSPSEPESKDSKPKPADAAAAKSPPPAKADAKAGEETAEAAMKAAGNSAKGAMEAIGDSANDVMKAASIAAKDERRMEIINEVREQFDRAVERQKAKAAAAEAPAPEGEKKATEAVTKEETAAAPVTKEETAAAPAAKEETAAVPAEPVELTHTAMFLNRLVRIIGQKASDLVDLKDLPQDTWTTQQTLEYIAQPTSEKLRALLVMETSRASDLFFRQNVLAAREQLRETTPQLLQGVGNTPLPMLLPVADGLPRPVLLKPDVLLDAVAPELSEAELAYATALEELATSVYGVPLADFLSGKATRSPGPFVQQVLHAFSSAVGSGPREITAALQPAFLDHLRTHVRESETGDLVLAVRNLPAEDRRVLLGWVGDVLEKNWETFLRRIAHLGRD